jgi:hypothetical protein
MKQVSIVAAFTTNNNANADFMSFVMPRVKVGGASKDDGEKGLIMTMPYTALLIQTAEPMRTHSRRRSLCRQYGKLINPGSESCFYAQRFYVGLFCLRRARVIPESALRNRIALGVLVTALYEGGKNEQIPSFKLR